MNASSIQSGQAPGRRLQAASLADYAPKSILALGAEPRRATAVLIEPVEEIYRMVGWQSVELPADAGPGDSVAAQILKRLRYSKRCCKHSRQGKLD